MLDLREHTDAWRAQVCGLGVAVRVLLTLRHAGFTKAVLVGELGELVRQQAEAHPYHALELELVSERPTQHDQPSIIFAAPVVLSSNAARQLADQCGSSEFEVETSIDESSYDYLVVVNDATGRGRAGRSIRNSCRKPVEFSGVMSVLFEQSMVGQITRVVSKLPITPNAVTIAAFFIGLAAVPFFLTGTYQGGLIGCAILFVNILFDTLDGQIARMKFRFSSFGEKLDNVSDSILNILILAPIGIGLTRWTGESLWSYIGWGGSIGAALYLLVVEYYMWKMSHGYSTGIQLWYRLNKDGSPKNKAAPTKPAAQAAPKTGIRRYLVPKYALRKDFLFAMYPLFAVFGYHLVPFCLQACGYIWYGFLYTVQFLFFRDRIRLADSHRGNV